MRILAVEDDAVSRKLLRAQLEAEGFDVLEAGDGLEALELLRRTSVDLVISDILMPNLDGFRLCHEIRRDGRLSQLPFILYTNTYNSPADRELALAVGADLFVTKPAPVPALIGAIATATAVTRQPRVPGQLTDYDENYVLKRYSEALMRKLEEKNSELELALGQLRSTHEQLLRLNAELETRVEQRTKQLEDANRELEAFTFTVSHDLRAPLRRIDGFTRLLESGAHGLDAEAAGWVETIRRGVREMAGLIEDLLAFSRAGRVGLRNETVDIGALADEVFAGLAAEQPGREIEWKRGALPPVRGDLTLLRQVLVNLLGNAIKYTRPRRRACVELTFEADDAGVALFCVRDNGVGFEPDYAEQVFRAFHRLHRQDEFEGSGVGLAIVQRIVERHGGRIWAEAKPDDGASFWFTLHEA